MMPLRSLIRKLRCLAREEQSGQALTEFVIIFPAQYLVIAGIIQFALYNVGVVVVNHAAYKAARAAIVADEPSQRARYHAEKAAIFTCSTIAGDAERVSTTIISYPGPGGPVRLMRSGAAAAKTRIPSDGIRYLGDTVWVKVEHDFELFIPIVRHIFKDPPPVGAGLMSPHVTISQACFMPCPWKPKGR